MKRRNRWLVPYLAAAVAFVIRVWMSTMRTRIITADGRAHPTDPRHEQLIYSFWHEGLLAPLATKPKIRVLISQHTDGEVIAQICERLGIGVIRGSTARGGCQALLEMIRSAGGDTHLGITPDGPRGPRRELKPGVVMIASQSGLAIVPVGIGFARAFRFRSWDRFALPLPFSMMVGVVGSPIFVPKHLDRAGLEHWVKLVENEMLRLTALAEDWAARIGREGSRAAAPAVSLPVSPAADLRKSA
jgi:lysophospholipid acyltransferase (LPLAT)-like uncharacterized protein